MKFYPDEENEESSDEWEEDKDFSDEEDEWEDEEPGDEDNQEDEEPSDDNEEDSEEENEESDEYEDEISDDVIDDDLILEGSEERGGWVHLRYRDSKGRFASPDTDPERKLDLEMDRKIRKFEKEYRKKIELPYNVKILLLRLVDDFKEKKHFYKDKDGFVTDTAYFPLSQFKRIPYHEVLKALPLKKSAFSLFVSKMVKKGLIVKIKHGHKLYLRITQKGLDRVYAFWEEYPGETWRFP